MNLSMLPFSLTVSALLLSIGACGVLLRRDPLVMFMSVELMLNAVNLAFISFGRFLNNQSGQIFALMVIIVAAAEVVVGLALVTQIYKTGKEIDIDDLSEMAE